MQLEFVTLDVFTDRLYGGNPLAVFPEATGLDGAEMQLIAREFNLSETVFVLPPEDPRNTRRLRIFTPAAELPFAGHPTVGTAHALAALGLIETSDHVITEVRFEQDIGVVPVAIKVERRQPVYAELSVAQLPLEQPGPLTGADAATLLSLEPAEILLQDPPTMVSCGAAFLFVALTSREALSRTRIDLAAWRSLLADAWAREVFAYFREPGSRIVHARMFAPALGIAEDPATGSAAAALALRLGRLEPKGGTLQRWRIEQGQDMGRPSLMALTFESDGHGLTSVRVGGDAVLVARGRLLRPPVSDT
jgi:trans-2,3-dihydro-3-hydroxyanthranilate isomerase